MPLGFEGQSRLELEVHGGVDRPWAAPGQAGGDQQLGIVERVQPYQLALGLWPRRSL